jgi:quinate dehydrogenase (quinone)
MTAIDLKTKQIRWQVPLGTTRDSAPLGFKVLLPMPIGLPTIGGSLVTKAGLILRESPETGDYLIAYALPSSG